MITNFSSIIFSLRESLFFMTSWDRGQILRSFFVTSWDTGQIVRSFSVTSWDAGQIFRSFSVTSWNTAEIFRSFSVTSWEKNQIFRSFSVTSWAVAFFPFSSSSLADFQKWAENVHDWKKINVVVLRDTRSPPLILTSLFLIKII